MQIRCLSSVFPLLAAFTLAIPLHASSDGSRRDLDANGARIVRAPADRAIVKALEEITSAHIRTTIESLVSFGNRSTLSSMTTDLPAGKGINAAADWIEAQFNDISKQCGGCLEVKQDTFTEQPMSRIPAATKITNVYAILRGSDPAQARRMYLVTGHYDSRNTDVLDTHKPAPGANDDASGVAVSIECARALTQLRPPATVVFVAVAGEEQGLNGSSHLAKLAKAEGWDLEGVLNNDIVGGNTTPGDAGQDKSTVRVFSEGIPAADTPQQAQMLERLGYASDSPSRELARAVLEVSQSYRLPAGSHPLMSHKVSPRSNADVADFFTATLIFRRDRFLRGGDHSSFNAEGFPAVRFTEWREDFNHQHQDLRVERGVQFGDLIQYVDMDYVANVARLNAAVLATLASAPPPPAGVKVVTKNLDNNTTLTWTLDSAATKYEVVWRALDAGEWQYAAPAEQFGGDGTATLPISKDNVIFGLRAVDAAGHRSMAVVPLPAQ
jgi:hypothetical protein